MKILTFYKYESDLFFKKKNLLSHNDSHSASQSFKQVDHLINLGKMCNLFSVSVTKHSILDDS